MKPRILLAGILAVGCAGIVAGCGGSADPSDGREPAGRATPETAATVVWAVGDIDAREPRAADVVEEILSTEPDRVLYLGDVYETGTAREFKDNFDAIFRPLAQRTLPTPGNHEWGLRAKGYFPYWKRVRGSAQPRWYRTAIGGWEIISLNSETDFSPGSPQARWINRTLDGAKGDCRIAFWHRPRYSAGSEHGDDASVDPLWELVRKHVRIVLTGHEHNLQRFKPVEGVISFVSGAGGRELYENVQDDPRLAFDEDGEFGALRLDLQPGVARHQFVDADGEVLDRGRVRCDDGQ